LSSQVPPSRSTALRERSVVQAAREFVLAQNQRRGSTRLSLDVAACASRNNA
jgi:hypothetical protein